MAVGMKISGNGYLNIERGGLCGKKTKYHDYWKKLNRS